jgi:hypothetical protein
MPPCRTIFFQIPVCRDDQPEVDRYWRPAADSVNGKGLGDVQ